MTFRKIFFFFFFLSFCPGIFAQNKISEVQPGKWQIGGLLGFSQYYGDVTTSNYFQKFSGETGFSTSAFVRYHFNELLGIGLNIHSGRINGEKVNFSDGAAANLAFNDRIFNFDVHSYLSLSNLFWEYSTTRRLNIYGTLGLGYISWNGSLSDDVTSDVIFVEKRLRVDSSNFKTSTAYFPLTLGMEYKLTPGLSFIFEGSLCTVFSDDVDFYKGGFKNDMLTFTSIGLSYRFGQIGTIKNKKKVSTVRPSEPVSVIDYDVAKSKPSQSQASVPVLTVTEPKSSYNKPFEFRVQILAKTSKVENIKRFFPNIVFDFEIRENSFGGIFRYSTGSFASFKEAEAYSQTMRNRGISDAFVVAYENNIRVTITKVMRSK